MADLITGKTQRRRKKRRRSVLSCSWDTGQHSVPTTVKKEREREGRLPTVLSLTPFRFHQSFMPITPPAHPLLRYAFNTAEQRYPIHKHILLILPVKERLTTIFSIGLMLSSSPSPPSLPLCLNTTPQSFFLYFSLLRGSHRSTCQ
jgi:hypothetical protein